MQEILTALCGTLAVTSFIFIQKIRSIGTFIEISSLHAKRQTTHQTGTAQYKGFHCLDTIHFNRKKNEKNTHLVCTFTRKLIKFLEATKYLAAACRSRLLRNVSAFSKRSPSYSLRTVAGAVYCVCAHAIKTKCAKV